MASPQPEWQPDDKPSIFEVPVRRRGLSDGVVDAVARGQEFLFTYQRPDHHWCAELESNAGITAEYVLMRQMLGLELDSKAERISRFLLSRQNEDGSWAVAGAWEGDVSTTVEVYLALRILGHERTELPLLKAERFIRRSGGIEKVRVFTRIFLAMFGLFPWKAVPAVPPELIFAPEGSPINVYSLASWARGTMVPLFVIFHHRPVFALPNGRNENNDWLDHLWLNPRRKKVSYAEPVLDVARRDGIGWKTLFGLVDAFLRSYERVKIKALRGRAIDRCTEWILEHQEGSGDWAGIFPPMINGVIALTLQGYGPESEAIRKGLEAIERFSWEDECGMRIQACESPVWDTALSSIALLDTGVERARAELRGAVDWVLKRQILVDYGDWKVFRPNLDSGGWSFEHFNSWYPDIDDTAAVVLMLLKQDPESARGKPVLRALNWLVGMQNQDGGWAAFDVENDKLFLNQIPFSDMDSLCDPSTPDVAGRVLEALGLWLRCIEGRPVDGADGLRRRIEVASIRGVGYLRRSQEEQGSWYGRWGVNYIYGTSNVLCGLAQLRVPASDPMIRAAVQWLRSVQNRDGGWGESLASYADPAGWMGRGESGASQTAWALMGLLGYLPSQDEAVERGIQWLVRRQVDANWPAASQGGIPVPVPRGGTWNELSHTGTGFPNHFYLRYNLYSHYFPLMALGRYLRKLAD